LWRRAIVTAFVLGVMAVLWFWVFPWADRTFVNRPAVEQGAPLRALAAWFRPA
jgi:hypothetical protein